jgi:site-specific DNA-methyltransferase (adenine-specific)
MSKAQPRPKHGPANALYYGDNLDILRRYIKDGSVDLIYLDPPFNSNADYNVLFAEKDGTQAHAQIKAFEDTWTWDEEAAKEYDEVLNSGHDRVARCLKGIHDFLGGSDMMAYLSMMALRLIELRRVLKPTGTIYLHCDPTASHYLKLVMDAVFGPENFRNEIIWHYYNKFQRGDIPMFANDHDIIFFYTKQKGDSHQFASIHEEREKPIQQLARKWDSRTKRIVNKKGEDGHVMYRTVTHRKIDDVWRLPYIVPASKEGLGYPTQKPGALLERILEASSNEKSIVLDPFCGCGTTVATAQKLKRRWIGIDITHLAINLIKVRLADAFGPKIAKAYSVIGEPEDLESAKALAVQDKYQFQYWALGLVGARPMEEKKGADKGIDGRLYITDSASETKSIIISVKGGNVTVSQLRDLRGVIERENAAIGVFITLEEPTAPMRKEAAEAGFFQTKALAGTKHPRLQILTIQELMGGKRVDLPLQQDVRAFKQAPKAKGKKSPEMNLPFDGEGP